VAHFPTPARPLREILSVALLGWVVSVRALTAFSSCFRKRKTVKNKINIRIIRIREKKKLFFVCY
jgi:hypothetical protein